ncbi:hypothetical protein ACHAPU_004207 [Fusarium lateritium]
MADVMTQTPPVLQGPSEKERKYDRQLRLWAASGQAALESANILLINSGAGTVGVETLKNLVLPGIGQFTIADPSLVSQEDLGVNFFVDDSWLGKSRAEACTNLLLELNPEVQGGWYPQPHVVLPCNLDLHSADMLQDGPFNLDNFLDNSPAFTMILYALPLPQDQIQLIQTYAQQHRIPAIAVHSVGYYSYFKVSLPGIFPIVDTHPDETATTDLRLLAPWPELTEFAKNMTENIASLEDHEHGHLPLVVILLHYLEQWRQTNGGAYPTSYVDKTAFRKTVSEAMRTNNPEGGEENFEEAVAAVMKHIVTPSIPGSLQQVFDYVHQEPEDIKSSFWIIAEAVKRFCSEHRRLPVPGGLPDMKAQSNVYIKLQNIYKERARQDVAHVLQTVRSIPGGDDVDLEQVELFCKNARFIKLINTSENELAKLDEVVEQQLANDEIAAVAGPEMPLSLAPLYLALLATSNSKITSADEIMAFVGKNAPQAAESERYRKTAQEVERAAGGELHNISAVMGGMVAQEMIKIITKQYVPIDNTCIFDGIDSRCQVLRL